MSALTPIVLAPLGALYGTATRTRLALYRRGLLPVRNLSVPVISVGNITTGGTGKTPLVEFIARALAHRGMKVCVLSRGYGRANPGRRVLVSDGLNVLARESEAGDEPSLLAETLLGMAAVISDADRYAAGEWAIKNLGSEILILDDGFQHLKLARELNLVAIDATQPWGNGHLLPWGRLREPLKELSRADCIVITRADEPTNLGVLRAEIARLIPGKPVFISRMRFRKLRRLERTLSERQELPAEELAGIDQPPAVFCAIGNAASFLTQLKSEGLNPVSTTTFRDHHRYSLEDVKSIVRKAKAAGARSLITTAKDAVKLRDASFSLPCYVLEIEIEIDEQSRLLETIYSLIAG